MLHNCKKMKHEYNAKTYLDLLPDELMNLIYQKLLYSIITSREFEIAQAWMKHKIITRRSLQRLTQHYSYYIEDNI